jgi:hypothetical protein
MTVITSISVKNEDFEYIKKNQLSATALFNIGLQRKKHSVEILDPESDDATIIDKQKFADLEQKLKNAIGAIQILTERSERAEASERAAKEMLKNMRG